MMTIKSKEEICNANRKRNEKEIIFNFIEAVVLEWLAKGRLSIKQTKYKNSTIESGLTGWFDIFKWPVSGQW